MDRQKLIEAIVQAIYWGPAGPNDVDRPLHERSEAIRKDIYERAKAVLCVIDAHATPPDALREALDEIVVRALAAQQAYADHAFLGSGAGPLEPKSEDVVREILDVLAPALAEAQLRIHK